MLLSKKKKFIIHVFQNKTKNSNKEKNYKGHPYIYFFKKPKNILNEKSTRCAYRKEFKHKNKVQKYHAHGALYRLLDLASNDLDRNKNLFSLP
jgi:hypothetical protein